jgi:hypothetical protein
MGRKTEAEITWVANRRPKWQIVRYVQARRQRPMMEDDKRLAEDLLWGAQAIADYLGLSTDQVYYLIRKKLLPIAKLGGSIVASKRQLVRYFEKITRGEQSESPEWQTPAPKVANFKLRK